MSTRPHAGQEREPRLPPIVCGVDDRYVVALCVLMESLARVAPGGVEGLRLLVLHRRRLARWSRGLIGFHAERLGLLVELRAVPEPDRRYPVSGWVSDAVYLRLAVPDVVEDEPIVLYLDVDVIVLGDLGPLLGHGLGGAPLAAVRDPRNPVVGRGIALPGWRELGIPEGREYFNSGVMLLDLEACRAGAIFERARRFLVEHPDQVRLWDQDALNWALEDAWLRLDRRWNTFALSPLVAQGDFVHHGAEPVMPLAELLADEDTASVLHYAGPDKPWADGYPSSRLGALYRRLLDATTMAQIHVVGH